MAETTRFSMADHPDLVEMRERYERISATGPAVLTDGLVLLAGLWLAISPWVIHFNTTARAAAAILMAGSRKTAAGRGR
jgi:SPW repeat